MRCIQKSFVSSFYTLYIAFYIQFICSYALKQIPIKHTSAQHSFYLIRLPTDDVFEFTRKIKFFFSVAKRENLDLSGEKVFDWHWALQNSVSLEAGFRMVSKSKNSHKDFFMRRERQIRKKYMCPVSSWLSISKQNLIKSYYKTLMIFWNIPKDKN